MRTLVLYVFHEYNIRVDYFIKNAIFKDDNVDFIIICNNPNLQFEAPEYVKILRRENVGYDFAAWSYGLFNEDNWNSYENFIFVNSSVIGPYLPKNFHGKWTDIFINGLTGNVKLFGSTINCQFFARPEIPLNMQPILFSHVQSYVFSMKKETLDHLVICGIFSNENKKHSESFFETIKNKEIGMSRMIIENNWNIGCLMSIYKGVDFRFIYEKPEDYNFTFLGDVMFSPYIGNAIIPEEVIFIKGNRCPRVPYPSNVE